MPRIARKDLNTCFFHVITQGINREYIFKKEEYINKYLKLIIENLKIYKIKILAYCIMSNHAHMLIYSEKTEELSNFMKKVDSTYGRFYNEQEKRVGFVFRNRFLSEPIYKESYLINCIEYIHNNPVKANMVKVANEYKYSSYNAFINNERSDIINTSILNEYINISDFEKNEVKYFKDVDTELKFVLDNELTAFLSKNNLLKEKFLKNKYKIREFLNYINKTMSDGAKPSIRQLSNLLKINRNKIIRIIKK